MRKLFLPVTAILISMTLLPCRYGYADSWHMDFDRICGSVSSGENLSTKSLYDLIEESGHLEKIIAKSNHPAKKVYLFRLKKCRAFFKYLIDMREEK